MIRVLRALGNACLTGGFTPQISWWKLVPGYIWIYYVWISDVWIAWKAPPHRLREAAPHARSVEIAGPRGPEICGRIGPGELRPGLKRLKGGTPKPQENHRKSTKWMVSFRENSIFEWIKTRCNPFFLETTMYNW